MNKWFYWNGSTKAECVLDILTLAPGEVAERDYFAQFDAYEFGFITSSEGVVISAWEKNAYGNKTVVHSLLPAELFPLGMEGMARAPEKMIPSALNQIYVLNSSRNTVSVFDRQSNTFIGNVIVGSGPFGIGVNSTTNRIYVANFDSHTVSVIDGNTNTVISKITVGTNSVGVDVNPTSNRIYVRIGVVTVFRS